MTDQPYTQGEISEVRGKLEEFEKRGQASLDRLSTQTDRIRQFAEGASASLPGDADLVTAVFRCVDAILGAAAMRVQYLKMLPKTTYTPPKHGTPILHDPMVQKAASKSMGAVVSKICGSRMIQVGDEYVRLADATPEQLQRARNRDLSGKG